MASEHILRIKAVLDTAQLQAELNKIKLSNNYVTPNRNVGSNAQGNITTASAQIGTEATKMASYFANLAKVISSSAENIALYTNFVNLSSEQLNRLNKILEIYNNKTNNVSLIFATLNDVVPKFDNSLKKLLLTLINLDDRVSKNNATLKVNASSTTENTKSKTLNSTAEKNNTSSAQKNSTAKQQNTFALKQNTAATNTNSIIKNTNNAGFFGGGGSLKWAGQGTASIMIASQLLPKILPSNYNLQDGEMPSNGRVVGDALTTAAQSAAMGMALGPWGAAIGGFIGAIAGTRNSLIEFDNTIKKINQTQKERKQAIKDYYIRIEDEEEYEKQYKANNVKFFEEQVLYSKLTLGATNKYDIEAYESVRQRLKSDQRLLEEVKANAKRAAAEKDNQKYQQQYSPGDFLKNIKLDALSDIGRFGGSTSRGEMRAMDKSLNYQKQIAKAVRKIANSDLVGVYA